MGSIIKGYNEYDPPAGLRAYIDRYWSYATDSATISSNSPLIIPDGCIDIIFDLNQPATLKSFVVGAMTKPMENTRTHLVGVRFNPGMAYSYLNSPVHEFTDQCVDYFEFAGQEANHLSSQLTDLNSTKQQIELLNKTFAGRLSSINAIEPKMVKALNLIQKTGGRGSIKQISDEVGWSRQHLTRQCLKYTGLTTKFLSQVIRIKHVIKQHGTETCNNLSQLSCDGGYYDQSHMINEFKIITGQTPMDFFD